MSVYCAAIECKYHSETNRCTAEEIILSSHSVITVWDGRQEFLKCKQYEMSEEYKALLAVLRIAEEAE